MAIQQTRTPGGNLGGRKGTFLTQLSDVNSTDLEGIGSIRQEGGKWYKWVKYDNGTANITAVAGLCVGYLAGDVSDVVCPDVSDTDNIGAGVLMGVPADQDFCWIQVKGLSGVLAQDVTAGAVGNALTLVGAADGEFDVSALVTDYIVGVLVVATASSQRVRLDCPL